MILYNINISKINVKTFSSLAFHRPLTETTFTFKPMRKLPEELLLVPRKGDKKPLTMGDNPISKESGFTLVELFMALVFAGSFTCLENGFSIIEKARDTRRLSQIQQSELEVMRSLNWSAIEAMATPATFTIQSKIINL